jgi:hypothetical protein
MMPGGPSVSGARRLGTLVPMPCLPRTWLAAVVAVALAALASGCGSDSRSANSSDERPFAPDGPWNRPLPRDAPIDPRSDALVAELRRQVEAGGTWINSYEYSVPIYRVPADQPRVRVKLDTTYERLERDFARVPVPRGAEPAAGLDAHMVVWQPATDTLWEFWHMARRPDGWHARWGGKMRDVSRNPGFFPAPLGATATGLPLMAGLIRAHELRRGRVEHALAFALPEARAGVFARPATRTDGQTEGDQAIPLGTRFRLDPELDLRELPRPTRMLARAVQRYGMIARDKSGSVTFYADAPRPGRPARLNTLLGTDPRQALERFPWERLEVVRALLAR